MLIPPHIVLEMGKTSGFWIDIGWKIFLWDFQSFGTEIFLIDTPYFSAKKFEEKKSKLWAKAKKKWAQNSENMSKVTTRYGGKKCVMRVRK